MIELKRELRLDKFNDRWQKCQELFDAYEANKNLFEERFIPDDATPRRVWLYKYNNSDLAWDKDCIAGLHDWHQPGANFPEDKQPKDQGSTIGDTVVRDKIYITQYCDYDKIPELEYFYNLRDAFIPDLEEKAKLFDTNTQLTLMLVKYSVPKDVDYHSYMFWNFNHFGVDHADDNYGSLHLGENSRAYYYKKDNNPITGNRLTSNHTIWGWGAYAEKYGYEPTVHGVTYLGGNKQPRYSIIFNLEQQR